MDIGSRRIARHGIFCPIVKLFIGFDGCNSVDISEINDDRKMDRPILRNALDQTRGRFKYEDTYPLIHRSSGTWSIGSQFLRKVSPLPPSLHQFLCRHVRTNRAELGGVTQCRLNSRCCGSFHLLAIQCGIMFKKWLPFTLAFLRWTIF